MTKAIHENEIILLAFITLSQSLSDSLLQSLSSSPSIGKDLREEVTSCLRKLEPLVKPLPPTTRRLPSGACTVSWEKCFPESGLEVTYRSAGCRNVKEFYYRDPFTKYTLIIFSEETRKYQSVITNNLFHIVAYWHLT